MMQSGRKKHAGGRPKGSKSKKTLEKLAHEALVRELVAKRLGPMTEAQIASAEGFKYLVVRDKKGGKFKRVTHDAPLDNDAELIEMWEKDPDTEAYRILLDRAYGRPTERLQADVTHEAGPKMEILLRNLKRVGNGHSSA